MSGTIAARLEELGLTLPKAAAPVAAYVPAVEQDGFLYISGQLPFDEQGDLVLESGLPVILTRTFLNLQGMGMGAGFGMMMPGMLQQAMQGGMQAPPNQQPGQPACRKQLASDAGLLRSVGGFVDAPEPL